MPQNLIEQFILAANFSSLLIFIAALSIIGIILFTKHLVLRTFIHKILVILTLTFLYVSVILGFVHVLLLIGNIGLADPPERISDLTKKIAGWQEIFFIIGWIAVTLYGYIVITLSKPDR